MDNGKWKTLVTIILIILTLSVIVLAIGEEDNPYVYTGITVSPPLNSIQQGIDNSAMTDKTYLYSYWDETTAQLTIVFNNTLSGADKIILDGIIGSPPTFIPDPVSRIWISPDGNSWAVSIDNTGQFIGIPI